MASQVFWMIYHCGLTSGFNKFSVVNCFGTFCAFLAIEMTTKL